MLNNKLQLIGNLGEDPKSIEKEGKVYTLIKLATRDSYPVKSESDTKWQNREAIWHEVFIFNPSAIKVANDFKKGDRVNITGSINYKPFKDEEGHTRRQVLIEGRYIEKAQLVANQNEKPSKTR